MTRTTIVQIVSAYEDFVHQLLRGQPCRSYELVQVIQQDHKHEDQAQPHPLVAYLKVSHPASAKAASDAQVLLTLTVLCRSSGQRICRGQSSLR